MNPGRLRFTLLLPVAITLAIPRVHARPPTPATETERSLPARVGVDWWNVVQHDIAQSEYRITRQTPSAEVGAAAAYQAPNRAQGFRTLFCAEGIRVMPRTAHRVDAPAWEWSLALAAWGRDGGTSLPEAGPARLGLAGERMEYQRDGIVEWYVNDARGLELGFTIARSPGEGRSADATAPGSREADPPCLDAGTSRRRSLVRLELAVGGNVTAAVADDRQTVDFMATGEARAIRFDHLRVTDAGGRLLPAWFEAGGPERLSIVLDDTKAAYPITVDPLATSPHWTAESDQEGGQFGASVATAGDVNGDGFSDVIVGAQYFDNGQTDEGRAFVYHGSASGLSLTANWTAESDQADASFGASVATAGDVNGDGFSDVVVGAWLFDSGQTDEGRVYVYHGSASGLSPAANWTTEGDQANAYFGISVAPAGDVNGDGFSDVIVGAQYFDNGQTDEGRAFVYHGSASGLSPTANWTGESDQANAGFGASVATAGDVNGDGFSDVVVGALYFDNGQTDEGRAHVYHGSASGLSPTANWTGESDQATAYFGTSVATAGDVNGDGFSDVVVGASFFDNGQTDEGRAFVYHGSASGLSSTANWTGESDQSGTYFGFPVAPAGDVNGDGFSDVIVGAPLFDNGQTDEGRAFVYHGSASGLSPTANWTTEGDQATAYYGRSVATAGDVNGDGLSDVIVGAYYFDNGQTNEGRAFVYHGSASGLSPAANWTTEGDQADAYFGISVAMAGDVNGDGFSDVIVGAQYFDNDQTDEGRAYVYHGSASGLSPTANWTGESDQANAYFGAWVATAGDVNGDGFSDVIVGARSFDNGQTDEGRAFVYHGSASGLSPTANWTGESDQATAYFGTSVATAGDVNGDGFSDVVVGASFFDNGQTDEGRAFVYHGSASGLSSTANWTGESDQSGTYFGFPVAPAGDVNGDGFSDVIVGAPLFDNGQTDEGRAFVYHGSASGLSPTANWTTEGDQATAYYGRSVATTGDVNGDGLSDVIVGAYYFDNGQTNEGRAFVYHGSASGLSPAANWTTEGDQADAYFGTSVAPAGDVNGDGFSDVIVGAQSFDNGQTDEGRAYVYHGSASGLSPTANWTGESDQADANFGASVATAGDVNGDGFSDVIVGAWLFDNGQADEGRVFVYNGNRGPGRRFLPRQLRTDAVTPIAPLGLSDSQTQFRIGATMLSIFGRTRLQMEHEVKPLGVLLDGTDLVAGSFSDIGNDGQIDVDRLVTGLNPDLLYHWRVRARYDLVKTPFQRNGPWVHMPANGWNEADLRTADTPVSVTLQAPSRFELRSGGANPGRGHCEIVLALPHAARVHAEVLDVLGRTVVVLAENAAYEAGPHVLLWDGRDQRGAEARAGVYLVRARAGGEVRAMKAVLAR